MTIYCYDTEFLEDGKTIDLISIGIVCEDGREYYAVNSDMDEKRIKNDDWLCKNVVPHLPVNKPPEKFEGRTWIWSLNMRDSCIKPKWVIANEVRDFMLKGVDLTGPSMYLPELWAYYAAYDHVALAQLWGKMIHRPKGLPTYTHDLKQEMDRLGVQSDLVAKPPQEHNALMDARWNLGMLIKLRQQSAA